MNSPDTTFDAASAVTRIDETTFTGDVSAVWAVGGRPHGGYLLALLARAATAVTPSHDHAIGASSHYVRAPEPGPVTITCDLLRAGKSASQVHVTMTQGNQRCVAALITTSHLDPRTKPYWAGGVPDPGSVTFEETIPFTPEMPDGTKVWIMDHVVVRFDPASMAAIRGEPSGKGEVRGWLEHTGRDFDPFSLLFAVDSFPPATFDVEFCGYVPTIELSAYVRAIPVPGPVRILQRAHLIDAQRVDEACFVWDSNGRLVAQSTQLAAIRLG
jgi:acyl-CoA thioesterase